MQQESVAPAELTLKAPPRLPPLVSVQVVLRSRSGAQFAALPQVASAISDFLDRGLPQFWSLPRACKANLLTLLPCLAVRGKSVDIDPCYGRYQCNQGLVSAVKHDNLKMVQLLHAFCPSVLPYNAMTEAVRTGDIRLLKILPKHHESVVWLPQMMVAAASTGQLKMLQYLHDHPKCRGFRTKKVFEAAVRGGHLDTMMWLQSHYGNVERKPFSAGCAAIYGGYTEVVMYLYAHPEQYDGVWFLPTGLHCAARKGDLQLLQWLYAKAGAVPGAASRLSHAVNAAAAGGHLRVVQWLHRHRSDGWTASAMDNAAQSGNLKLAQWFQENRSEGCTSVAMDNAAAYDHLHIVKWLHENRSEGCSSSAMDYAALGDYSEIVKWLHENRAEGCTTDAMDYAAVSGSLKLLKWFHSNRTEGYTTDAMDSAAAGGHLEALKWLHENRTEGCATGAMDYTAKNGHLDVVKWLHENRREGCTPKRCSVLLRMGSSRSSSFCMNIAAKAAHLAQ